MRASDITRRTGAQPDILPFPAGPDPLVAAEIERVGCGTAPFAWDLADAESALRGILAGLDGYAHGEGAEA